MTTGFPGEEKLVISPVSVMVVVCCLVTKSCLTLLQPHGLHVVHKAPLSMGFSQAQNTGVGSSPGDLPNSGIEPMSPALTGRFFTTELTREALVSVILSNT